MVNTQAPANHTIIFYDGQCGFCHRFVRFVALTDIGSQFDFSPRSGETFARLFTAEQKAKLPESMLVRLPSGEVLSRSTGIAYILEHLEGWKTAGKLLRLFPTPLRDLGYSWASKIRKKIFKAPETACPILPGDLQKKFLP